jgi:hypothetical protein
MSRHSSKISFANRRSVPLLIVVEPWAYDFTLMPGEALDIVGYSDRVAPWFYVVESDDASQVYCEECDIFDVLQEGVLLECGHKRQAAVDG